MSALTVAYGVPVPEGRSLTHGQSDMAIEEFREIWIRVDLYCDGLGEDGTCVLDADDDIGMISDVANNAEGARTTVLHAAESAGWVFDLKLRRWLCPDCVARRDGLANSEE
jgi:hypothetical protein